MCNQPPKYVRFTQRRRVRELDELFKESRNSAPVNRNCGDRLPKDGPPLAEYACHDCFVKKGWDYDLRTRR
jgi:hypothetical protein